MLVASGVPDKPLSCSSNSKHMWRHAGYVGCALQVTVIAWCSRWTPCTRQPVSSCFALLSRSLQQAAHVQDALLGSALPGKA